MAMMKLVVFNVELGQCVYIRTPNDYGILIDCGKSSAGETPSPAKWLADNEAPTLKPFGGRPIAAMVVTHPHDAHLADIGAIQRELPRGALWRDTDYDWPAVLNVPGCPGDNLKAYHAWQSSFVAVAEPEPDFGATVRRFSLSQQEADQLGGGIRDIVNNRSIVTVITYKSAEGYTWKVVVAGDNQTAGWEALLAKPEFCAEIKGADVFVTSHHGDESGFCAGLFKVMGKPLANVTSTRRGGEPVDKRYGKLAQGVKFPDGSRTHFETRDDGNVTIAMHDDGRYDVWLFTP